MEQTSKQINLQDSVHIGVEANRSTAHQGVTLEGSRTKINSQQPYEANITDILDISHYEMNTQQTGTQRFATGRI